MSSEPEEEMVAVSLGDDYYKGESFITQDMDSSTRGDYLVQRSQLERWEQAMADYGQMQSEIEQVMDEQRERVRALRGERPKTHLESWVQKLYAPVLQQHLEQTARFRDLLSDPPPLVADAKIDRDEEERGL